ncbi:ATP-binding cassette domain-containing protein [Faecalibacterium prausnitzii]|uniref:ATP-binding cassette domain-containing protein n=1 Tax=Faecalibacterium prausnitzii TaxID=853 RepID=UPI0037C18A12
MAESIVTTLLQATKNDLEFYFCFIGDAWIGKPGAFWRFPCLWLYQSVRFRLHRTPAEEVLAAKLANCEEFAEKLPDKWNTNIGENGCALSGGERQRISIARAFLKDAPIILLDEATASLDVENETAIQEALSRLIKNKTVLIIAHRMRTVAGADQVVVLSGGIVAEQGSPAELYARKGLYTHMVDLQSASQNWTI